MIKKKNKYINRFFDGGFETVDELPYTTGEDMLKAQIKLREYMASDPKSKFKISQACSKNWELNHG